MSPDDVGPTVGCARVRRVVAGANCVAHIRHKPDRPRIAYYTRFWPIFDFWPIILDRSLCLMCAGPFLILQGPRARSQLSNAVSRLFLRPLVGILRGLPRAPKCRRARDNKESQNLNLPPDSHFEILAPCEARRIAPVCRPTTCDPPLDAHGSGASFREQIVLRTSGTSQIGLESPIIQDFGRFLIFGLLSSIGACA